MKEQTRCVDSKRDTERGQRERSTRSDKKGERKQKRSRPSSREKQSPVQPRTLVHRPSLPSFPFIAKCFFLSAADNLAPGYKFIPFQALSRQRSA